MRWSSQLVNTGYLISFCVSTASPSYLCTYLCTCMSRAVPLAEKLAVRAIPHPRRLDD